MGLDVLHRLCHNSAGTLDPYTLPDLRVVRRKRLIIASGVTVLSVMALAAAALWWYLGPRPPVALEQGWTSRVLVLAGDGVREARDADAAHARFSEPFGVAIGTNGAVYVTD